MATGNPAQTPVILIQWGTCSQQKTLAGTIETISTKAEVFQFPRFTYKSLLCDAITKEKCNKISYYKQFYLLVKQL